MNEEEVNPQENTPEESLPRALPEAEVPAEPVADSPAETLPETTPAPVAQPTPEPTPVAEPTPEPVNKPAPEPAPEPVAKVDEAEIKKWKCEISDLEGQLATKENPWTVGQKLSLKCNGETLNEKLAAHSKIEFAEESSAYTLNILDVKYSDYDNAQFIVTAYKVGDLKGGFFITDGKSKIEVPSINWNITSVIEKGTIPMPYGPMPPFKLSLPWWFWVALVIAILGIGFVAVKKIIKRSERKRLIEELATHGTALTPYYQFSKDMRHLARQFETSKKSEDYLLKLDEAFRMYLVRQLFVPAMEWKSREVMSEIKSRYKKIHEDYGQDLSQLLKEYDEAKKSTKNVTMVDCEQLAHMSRIMTEKIMKTTRKSN